MARALAIQIAELAHFENEMRSRLTIVHRPCDSEAVEAFRSAHPRLMPPPGFTDAWRPRAALDDWKYGVRVRDRDSPDPSDRGIEFVFNGGFTCVGAGARSAECVEAIIDAARSPGVRPIVFLCGDSDDANITDAQALRFDLDGRLKQHGEYLDGVTPVIVFVHSPYRAVLASLVATSELIPFGSLAEVCSFHRLRWSVDRWIAEEIALQFQIKAHAKEVERLSKVGAAPPAAFAPVGMAGLSDWERKSNFAAAAHVPVKLAMLGLRLERRGAGGRVIAAESVTREQRDLVARVEHNRWIAERLLAGWTYGTRSNERKRRTAMVDWASLNEGEWVKDADQVDQILRMCGASTEFAIVADEAGRPADARKGGLLT